MDDRPPSDNAPVDGPFGWSPPTAEALQALMPGYTIEKPLGQGGMGAVYRGMQTSLERPVAIKILPPGTGNVDPSFAERFKNEAKLMARLNHPGVVSVYDFGATSDGQLYIVMEYVDGSDVQNLIREQKHLPPEHALAITAHVCDALGAAHKLGIVHRDIKPANILINMDGAVKVADFGLAKVDDPESQGLTKSGYSMGTPDYISPESFALGSQVDGRADLYAVGVMLYQMLTGNMPRGAYKSASELKPDLDPRFDDVIDHAMQHDREDRYQTAEEMRQALDVILTTPHTAPEDSSPVPAMPSLGQDVAGEGARTVIPYRKPAMSTAKKPSNVGWIIGAISATALVVVFLFLRPEPTTPKSDLSQKSEEMTREPDEGEDLPAVTTAPEKKSVKPVENNPVDEPLPAESELAASPPPKEAPALKLVVQESPTIEMPTPPSNESPMPEPDSKKPPEPSLPAPATESDPYLAKLESGFQSRYESDAQKPFEADVAKLNQSYLARGVTRARAEAQARGSLAEVKAFDEIKARIERGESVPEEDEPDTPESVKALRTVYRTELAKLEEERAQKIAPLFNIYLEALDAYVEDLTKSGKIGQAEKVAEWRSEISWREAQRDLPAFQASEPSPLVNSLGMKFIPVSGTKVLFCIHETRFADFTAYAEEVPKARGWWERQQKFDVPCGQEDEEPVVGITWEEAKAFCAWLSKKEGRVYRLPTDREWSFAAGIGPMEEWTKETTPEMLNDQLAGVYPWGKSFPPRTSARAGNYADVTWHDAFANFLWMNDPYNDGFATTSPVMSFKPNELGLYDIGGNASEWTEDWWNDEKAERVRRGSSFMASREDRMLLSHRFPNHPTYRDADTGFRVVIAVE